MNFIGTIKINGTERNVVNTYSAGPECPPRTWEIEGGYRVEEWSFGWVMTGRGIGQFIPELSVFGVRLESVDTTHGHDHLAEAQERAREYEAACRKVRGG